MKEFLDERAMLARTWAALAQKHGDAAEAARWTREGEEAPRKAAVLRQLLA